MNYSFHHFSSSTRKKGGERPSCRLKSVRLKSRPCSRLHGRRAPTRLRAMAEGADRAGAAAFALPARCAALLFRRVLLSPRLTRWDGPSGMRNVYVSLTSLTKNTLRSELRSESGGEALPLGAESQGLSNFDTATFGD